MYWEHTASIEDALHLRRHGEWPGNKTPDWAKERARYYGCITTCQTVTEHAFLELYDEYSHCNDGYCFIKSRADDILPHCDNRTEIDYIIERIKQHPDSIVWDCSREDIKEHLYEIIEQHIPDYFHRGCRYNNPACPSSHR